MKRLDWIQGSENWLAWRRSILSATDASIIIGTNPFKDTETLRKQKLGLLAEDPLNSRMKMGQLTEPIARDHFNENNPNLFMTPAVVESSEVPYLGASLDGITDDDKAILEIKCSEKTYKEAEKGIIAPYYLTQIQKQLLVTNAEICYYYAYHKERAICIEVKPDPDFKEVYLPLAEEFWMSLIFYKPVIYVSDTRNDLTNADGLHL